MLCTATNASSDVFQQAVEPFQAAVSPRQTGMRSMELMTTEKRPVEDRSWRANLASSDDLVHGASCVKTWFEELCDEVKAQEGQ